MKTKNKDILCIGEVMWDRLPDKSIPGGAPMNVGLHLVKVGYNVQICSSLGDDQAGREFSQYLQSTDLDTHLVQTNRLLPTSEVPIYIDEYNNPAFDILEPVAWDQLELTPQLEASSQAVGTIVYGSLASRNEMTRETIRSILSNDNIKIMDVNMRPPHVSQAVVENLIRHADIVKMNDDELHTMAKWHNVQSSDLKELIRWFSDTFGTSIICVTRGKDGAMVWDHGEISEHQGFKVKAVDTVGSGDAFLAGFVSVLFDGDSAAVALKYACALGAYVATKPGATPTYHTSEIQKILEA